MENFNTQRTLAVSHESLNNLKRQSLLFEQTNAKLNERDRVLFGMIEGALRRKDDLRANMFANELNRVRHLKKIFSQSQLVMECITIRMENLLDLYEAIQMDPVSQVIREVLGDVQGVGPEFVSGLEKLTQMASDTLKQTTIGFKQPELEKAFTAKNAESIAILKEVSNKIESQLKEQFPEPPVSEAPTVAESPVEALGYGYEPTFSPKKATITDTTNDLTMISDAVVKMLDSLNTKQRLSIEETNV